MFVSHFITNNLEKLVFQLENFKHLCRSVCYISTQITWENTVFQPENCSVYKEINDLKLHSLLLNWSQLGGGSAVILEHIASAPVELPAC